MRPADFELLANLLKLNSGLVLTPDKAYLLESRLMPVARKHQIPTMEALADKVRGRPDDTLLRDITEAMTTNESSFFRDSKPFDQLKDVLLPRMLQSRSSRKQLRIWCAAASSGQEPYSISMILKEAAAQLAGWRIEIIGTDLSNPILERAKEGIYTQFEVQRGLPITLLVKYFKQEGDKWRISDEIRRMVTYKRLNLLQPFNDLGQFDIVFCRNVLIYFDQPTKAKVLEAISKQMPNDGVLLLGGAETVLGVTDRFRPMEGQRGLYELSTSPALQKAV
jgi:chemotaxis protein methyltransferase CheR